MCVAEAAERRAPAGSRGPFPGVEFDGRRRPAGTGGLSTPGRVRVAAVRRDRRRSRHDVRRHAGPSLLRRRRPRRCAHVGLRAVPRADRSGRRHRHRSHGAVLVADRDRPAHGARRGGRWICHGAHEPASCCVPGDRPRSARCREGCASGSNATATACTSPSTTERPTRSRRGDVRSGPPCHRGLAPPSERPPCSATSARRPRSATVSSTDGQTSRQRADAGESCDQPARSAVRRISAIMSAQRGRGRS